MNSKKSMKSLKVHNFNGIHEAIEGKKYNQGKLSLY